MHDPPPSVAAQSEVIAPVANSKILSCKTLETSDFNQSICAHKVPNSKMRCGVNSLLL